MKNKILALTLAIFCIFTNVFAYTDTNIIDFRADEENYTASQASEIKLPFIRMTDKKVVLDKDINKAGLVITANAVEILNSLTGMHFISAGEEVVIKGKIENAVILSPKVKIEGEVTGTLVNISQNLEITEKAKVKELYTYSNNVVMNGVIKENLLGHVNKLELKGNVEKDLRMSVENLKIDAGKVKGSVYFKTHNKDLNAKYVYPDAKVELKETTKKEEKGKIDFSYLIVSVLSCMIIYYLFENATKNKTISKCVELVKNKTTLILIIATVSFMSIMPVVFVSSLLIAVGFTNIGIAALALFIGIFVAACAMSLFIVGAYITKLISNKYLRNKRKYLEYIVLSIVLAILYVISNVGYGFTLLIAMLAVGIIGALIIGKKEEI